MSRPFHFASLPPLQSGCNGTVHCTSEGSHYERCPKLAADLVAFKAKRREQRK